MKDEKVVLWPWIIFGTLFILILWILTPIVTTKYFPNNYGLFGDQFGSINSLFSGLAFLGLIVAILLQRKELIDQRKELRLTREVHESSTKILKEQFNIQYKSNLIQSYNIIIDYFNQSIKELISLRPYDYKKQIVVQNENKQLYLNKLKDLLKSLEDSYAK